MSNIPSSFAQEGESTLDLLPEQKGREVYDEVDISGLPYYNPTIDLEGNLLLKVAAGHYKPENVPFKRKYDSETGTLTLVANMGKTSSRVVIARVPLQGVRKVRVE